MRSLAERRAVPLVVGGDDAPQTGSRTADGVPLTEVGRRCLVVRRRQVVVAACKTGTGS